MNDHPRELLPLLASEALTANEAAEVAAHVQDCAFCAARLDEWRVLTDALREHAPAPCPPAIIRTTLRAVESRMAQRSEERWIGAALVPLVALGWTTSAAIWIILRLLSEQAALPPMSVVLGFAAYVGAGWVMGGVTAVLLKRRTREEWRIA